MFFGMENPNLRSDLSLEVNVSHWRSLRSSNDLQNWRHLRIHPLTHVWCLFLSFLGRRIRIRGQIEVKRSVESLGSINDLHWPPKWWSFQNTPSYTYAVFFPRFFVVENPIWGQIDVQRSMESLRSFNDLQNGGHFRIQFRGQWCYLMTSIDLQNTSKYMWGVFS